MPLFIWNTDLKKQIYPAASGGVNQLVLFINIAIERSQSYFVA